MIIANIPLKRQEVKDLAASLNIDGNTYELVKEEGMNLYFSHTHPDADVAAAALKKAVKGLLGGGYYFNIRAEDAWERNKFG